MEGISTPQARVLLNVLLEQATSVQSKPNAAVLTICDASDRCLLVVLSVSPR